jgi:hypothetical protein
VTPALALLVALAAPLKVSITLRDATAQESAVEKALVAALKDVPGFEQVKSGAQRTLTAEVARIGEGRVLYLGAGENGKPLGSTSATLSSESGDLSAADKKAVRAAVVRLLAPERHVGRLVCKVDVAGAVVMLDGNPQQSGNFEAPVGTHALRVTHPAYRDFLRFVDVAYDDTLTVDVALSAYPLTEGEMAEKLKKPTAPVKKTPWYRSWWLLTISGVALTGATIGIVWAARPGFGFDQKVDYRVP